MGTENIEGKVALVTGAASGIGKACVEAFAAGGARVVIADRDAAASRALKEIVQHSGGTAMATEVDVAAPTSVQQMIAQTIEQYGRLDIAVNNAGISGEANRTGDYGIDSWQRVIDVNLNGVFYCMRYEIPQMTAQGSGAIVNMASILGAVGFSTAPAYVAAKHALLGLTKTAALEYAREGLRINAVGPAFIHTPLIDHAMDQSTQDGIAALHPVGRMGDPEEVAELVTFLCSDRASFLTGAYYLADGGYTAQ